MKRRYLILLVAVLLLAVAFFYVSNPLRHVKTFVSMYGQQIEDSILVGDGVPENLGCISVELWEEEHTMIEFILSGWGLGSDMRYYGCYYSPENIPLPFQNADVALTRQDENTWVWKGSGDNQGSTQKIRDNWYYFEASF